MLDVQTLDWAAVYTAVAKAAGGKPNRTIVAGMAAATPEVFTHFSIDTVDECAAFVSQGCLETDYFKTLSEYWGPTAAQRGYEGRKDLGNTVRGDGHLFMGHGVFQTTGRANHAEATREMRKLGHEVDYVAHPEHLARPWDGMWAAGIYWGKRNLGRYASNPSQMSRAINRGNAKSTHAANHEADRIRLFGVAQKAINAALAKAAKPPKAPIPPKVDVPALHTDVPSTDLPWQGTDPANGTTTTVTVDSAKPSVSVDVAPSDTATGGPGLDKGDAEPPVPVTTVIPAPKAPVATAVPVPQSKGEGNVILAHLGDKDNPMVMAVETKLHSLNYPCGTVEGDFDTLTRDALMSYCANKGLPVRVDVLDSFTATAILADTETRPLSEKRTEATANSPELKSSRQIVLGKLVTRFGGGLLSIFGINVATDAIDPAQVAGQVADNKDGIISKLGAFQSITEAVFTSKITVGVLLVTLIAVGLGFVWLRVQDHRNGNNLGR